MAGDQEGSPEDLRGHLFGGQDTEALREGRVMPKASQCLLPEVRHCSITVAVTPSDLEVNYCAKFIATSELASKSDATIIDEVLNGDDLTMLKGVKTISASGLSSNTSYTLVAFGIQDTKVTRKEYATEASADVPAEIVSPEDFNIDIQISNIRATSAQATATPNGANRYYFRVITKMELDAFGIYNDDYQIFEYIIENPNSGDYITQGETTTRNATLAITAL